MPVSLALPLTYGYDAFRGFLLKTVTIIPIQYEVGLLVVFMFIMVWLGQVVFNRMEKKVRTLGTLGQH
jgi:ABC-2 type transport system permease protein